MAVEESPQVSLALDAKPRLNDDGVRRQAAHNASAVCWSTETDRTRSLQSERLQYLDDATRGTACGRVDQPVDLTSTVEFKDVKIIESNVSVD